MTQEALPDELPARLDINFMLKLEQWEFSRLYKIMIYNHMCYRHNNIFKAFFSPAKPPMSNVFEEQ